MHFTGTKSSPQILLLLKYKKMFSSHRGHLTNAMYHHGKNTLIKLLHHDETKKKAHDSQIVRAEENLMKSLFSLHEVFLTL